MSSSSFWTKPLGIAVMVLGLCGVVMIGIGVYSIVDHQSKQARKELLGTWREANVASYSANRLKVANEGVYWNGDLISTHFSFDGATLEFKHGNKRQEYYLDRLKGTLVHINGNYKAQYLKQGYHGQYTQGRN